MLNDNFTWPMFKPIVLHARKVERTANLTCSASSLGKLD